MPFKRQQPQQRGERLFVRVAEPEILPREALADVGQRFSADGDRFPRRAAVRVAGRKHSVLPQLRRRVGIGRLVDAVEHMLPQVFLQPLRANRLLVVGKAFQIRGHDPAAVLRPRLPRAEGDAAEIAALVYGLPLVCQRPAQPDFGVAQRVHKGECLSGVFAEHVGEDVLHARLAGFLLPVEGFGHMDSSFRMICAAMRRQRLGLEKNNT